MHELKRLSRQAFPAALDRAEHYRLLNEPGQAESICRDVLEQDADDQRALITLLLALTDQFSRRAEERGAEARALIPRLHDEYARAYYTGIVFEREARALWRRGTPGSGPAVYEGLRRAMEWFERAETLGPRGNADALLRWNACARMIDRHDQLQPGADDEFRPLLE